MLHALVWSVELVVELPDTPLIYQGAGARLRAAASRRPRRPSFQRQPLHSAPQQTGTGLAPAFLTGPAFGRCWQPQRRSECVSRPPAMPVASSATLQTGPSREFAGPGVGGTFHADQVEISRVRGERHSFRRRTPDGIPRSSQTAGRSSLSSRSGSTEPVGSSSTSRRWTCSLVFTTSTGAPIRRGSLNKLVSWTAAVASIGQAGLHFCDLRHTGTCWRLVARSPARPDGSGTRLDGRCAHLSAREPRSRRTDRGPRSCRWRPHHGSTAMESGGGVVGQTGDGA